MKTILVANPKGGSGKTTLSVNIAGYLANQGQRVAILDLDRQKSASLWVATRPDDLPEVVTLDSKKVDDPLNDCLVIDSPAGLLFSSPVSQLQADRRGTWRPIMTARIFACPDRDRHALSLVGQIACDVHRQSGLPCRPWGSLPISFCMFLLYSVNLPFTASGIEPITPRMISRPTAEPIERAALFTSASPSPLTVAGASPVSLRRTGHRESRLSRRWQQVRFVATSAIPCRR